MAEQGGHDRQVMDAALKAVQSLDPAGVGARDLKECLLLQIESKNGKGGVAWQIVSTTCGCSKRVSSRNWRRRWAGRRNTSISRSR
jgi:DNA-directed RNA polymerase specialized sigma54-like protein